MTPQKLNSYFRIRKNFMWHTNFGNTVQFFLKSRTLIHFDWGARFVHITQSRCESLLIIAGRCASFFLKYFSGSLTKLGTILLLKFSGLSY